MSSVPQDPDTPADQQREALNEAEKAAAEPQPGSYREAEDAAKVVGVRPVDADGLPMQGLDP